MIGLTRRLIAATLVASLTLAMAAPAGASDVPTATSWNGTIIDGAITASSCVNPARNVGGTFRAESYTVAARQGQQVRLYMAGADSSSGTLGDPFLQVTNGEVVVAGDDDGGTGYDAYLVVSNWQDHYVVRATTYNAGEEGTFTLYVGDGTVSPLGGDCASPQAIDFPQPGAGSYGDAVTLTATASSGLPVAYTSVTADVCTIDASTASLISTGTCRIAASQDGNETFTAAATIQRDFAVTAKSLTVSGLGADDKVYDATDAATLTGEATLDGTVGDDEIALVGDPTAAFDSPSAGPRTVRVDGLSLSGADAGLYTLPSPTLDATITRREVQVGGLQVADRPYDRTTDAVLSGTPSLVGVVAGDAVVLDGTAQATFAAPQAGEQAYAVTGLSLAGAARDNYLLAAPTGAATITPRLLTITGLAATSRMANGGTGVELTGVAAVEGVLGDDDVTLTGDPVGTLDSAAAGRDKPVTITGLSLAGVAAVDYGLSPLTLTATITPRPVPDAPAPVPLPSGQLPTLSPGQSGSVVGGQQQTVVIEPLAAGADRTGLSARGDGFGLDLDVASEDGRVIERDGDRLVAEVTRGHGAALGGYGFAPSSMVNVWVFSEPRLLGSVEVDASGSFEGAIVLPEDLPVGSHTLQVDGRTASGATQAVSLGIVVRDVPPVCGAARTSPFRDVARSNVHAENIDCLATRGVVHGTTQVSYAPADQVTRGQLASLVARFVEDATGAALPNAPTTFSDTPGTTHASAIAKLAAVGIVSGTSSTTFAPHDTATRAHVAAVFARALQASGMTLPDRRAKRFGDVAAEHAHSPEIDALVQLGVVAGVTATRFDPAAPVRRSQVATIWVRAAEAAYDADTWSTR